MEWLLQAVGKTGATWDLWGPAASGVVVEEGGLSDLRGVRDEASFQVVGRDGVRRTPTRFKPLSLRLSLVFYPHKGLPVGRVLHDWLEAWQRGGTLVLSNPAGGRWELPCRIPDDSKLSEWQAQPDRAGFARMDFDLVADGGCWVQRLSSVDSVVEIENFGESVVCPRLVWGGNSYSASVTDVATGAKVYVPSFSSGRRVLSFDVGESFMVTDADGNPDDALWRRVRGGVFGIAIPPGGSRRLQVAGSGSRLEWEIGTSTPWL